MKRAYKPLRSMTDFERYGNAGEILPDHEPERSEEIDRLARLGTPKRS